jgi:hypothetical protein
MVLLLVSVKEMGWGRLSAGPDNESCQSHTEYVSLFQIPVSICYTQDCLPASVEIDVLVNDSVQLTFLSLS